ncbi:hypothetical protein FRC03_009577 [Tulasnella sp. 419]|nr:hypothetical protein FRC03_009577 [Tulasnella sp. 419]
MAAAATPGLFFCIAATVLLIIATVSAPVWDAVSFLDANINGREVHFGVFGYTGSGTKLGYSLAPQDIGIGYDDSRVNNVILKNLTYVLILHPIAAGFAFIAVVFGICGAANHRSGTIIMAIASAMATVLTLVVWVIDMVLWGITRNRIRNAGDSAQYGNANWMVLGALIALVVGFCTSICGVCGRYSRRGRYNEKV